MVKVKRDARGLLTDISETPSESNASKSSSPCVAPEQALQAADSQAAGPDKHFDPRPDVGINTSSIAAAHAKKVKLEQQLQNVERQVIVRHMASTHAIQEQSVCKCSVTADL